MKKRAQQGAVQVRRRICMLRLQHGPVASSLAGTESAAEFEGKRICENSVLRKGCVPV